MGHSLRAYYEPNTTLSQATAYIRIVYRPHNRWFLQIKTEQKSSKTIDPWEDQGVPKDTKDQAELLMYQRFPALKGKIGQ